MTGTTPDIRVGDTVTRSAKGKQFVVIELYTPTFDTGGQWAALKPVEGYTRATHPVNQLALIERPGGTS